MKTAISIPDRAFRRVEKHAAKMRMSRSEFFTRAAERWADELDDADTTQAINDALELAGDEDQADAAAFAREAAVRTLSSTD